MSGAIVRALLRVYPRAWRDRYGEELSSLIEQAGSGRSTARVAVDVLLSGLVERMRSLCLAGTGTDPADRVRSGLLRILWAWVIFVVGGIGVAKASEHWSDAFPRSGRGVPSAAYGTLVGVSAVGSLAVVLGVVLTGRELFAFLRHGGWSKVRVAILRALVLTLATIGGLIGVASFAHHLTHAQRNGGDVLYSAIVIVFVVLFVASLVAWTVAAVNTARLLAWSHRALSAEAVLGAVVAVAMVVMTIATAVWWLAVARDEPWFFAGTPAGTGGTELPLNLVLAGCLMVVGVVLGCSGAASALRKFE